MADDEIERAASAPPIEADAGDESAVEATPPADDTETVEASPVAEAVAELDSLADRDLAEHPEIFERIHGQLHAALTAIDDA